MWGRCQHSFWVCRHVIEPWMHQPPGTGSGNDHLYNFLTAAAAIVAVLTFAGGLAAAILYRHKATLGIEAELSAANNGSILAVRPSVGSVGPFKLRFADMDGSVVEIIKVFPSETGTRTEIYDPPKRRNAFPADEKGNNQFVSPGETLASSLLFRVDPIPTDLFGWLVAFNVASKGRLIRRGLYWADRIFLPVGSSPKIGGSNGGPGATKDKEARGARPPRSEEQDSPDRGGRRRGSRRRGERDPVTDDRGIDQPGGDPDERREAAPNRIDPTRDVNDPPEAPKTGGSSGDSDASGDSES